MNKQQSLHTWAILAMLGATLGYVFINVSIRLLGTGFEPITLTYLRFGAGFLLGLLFLGRSVKLRNFIKISVKDWLLLLCMGIIGYAIPIYLFTLGVFRAPLLIVSVLSATIPFFTLIFSIVIFKKLPKLFVIPFLCISLFGVMVISTNSLVPAFTKFGMGEIYILAFAAFAGTYPIFRKLLSSTISNSEITLSIIPIAIIGLLCFAFSMHETIHIESFFHWQALLGLVIGGTLNVVLTQAENFAFGHLESVFATQLALTENIFAPIVGFLLYKEIPSSIEVLGALLIIVGIYGVNKFTQ